MSKRNLAMAWVGWVIIGVGFAIGLGLNGAAVWAIITSVGISAALLGSWYLGVADPVPPEATLDEVRFMVSTGQKSRAIRWYRVITGASLRKATDEVDWMETQQKRSDNAR